MEEEEAPSSIKKKLFLIIFYDCIGIKMNILMLYIFLDLKVHLLTPDYKRSLTLSWAPKGYKAPGIVPAVSDR